jgi:hypothetical protein
LEYSLLPPLEVRGMREALLRAAAVARNMARERWCAALEERRVQVGVQVRRRERWERVLRRRR